MNSRNKRVRVTAEILLACIMTVFLGGCSVEHTAKDRETLLLIKVGSDSYPPYNYLDEDGMAIGIDVELAKAAFKRMGYKAEFVYIDWERKKELVDSGEIDCIMGCFSMEGRLEEYNWAGSYMVSNQVVAVKEDSEIYSLSDLEGKNIAVQSTTKPDGLFLNRTDSRIPEVGNLISLEKRELMYTFLAKDYVDAIAAHETSILQYMKDYGISYRILDEPLMTVGIGVAFSRNDERGICEKMDKTLEKMRQDGTSERIIGKYLEDPKKYLEVDQLAY